MYFCAEFQYLIRIYLSHFRFRLTQLNITLYTHMYGIYMVYDFLLHLASGTSLLRVQQKSADTASSTWYRFSIS